MQSAELKAGLPMVGASNSALVGRGVLLGMTTQPVVPKAALPGATRGPEDRSNLRMIARLLAGLLDSFLLARLSHFVLACFPVAYVFDFLSI